MVFAGFISYWMGVTGNVNRWMGFRTRATLSDVDVWVVINKRSGIALMVEGVGIVLISLVFRDLAVANYLTFIMLAMVVLISTVIKFVYDASKMAKRLSKPETPQ
jgi:uncharacterized membrane protein